LKFPALFSSFAFLTSLKLALLLVVFLHPDSYNALYGGLGYQPLSKTDLFHNCKYIPIGS